VCTLTVQNQAKQDAHTGPPLAIAFSRGGHMATRDPKQENNQGIPGRSQVPQTNPPATRLHNSNKRQNREKQLTT
jgi:hypothetical protein